MGKTSSKFEIGKLDETNITEFVQLWNEYIKQKGWINKFYDKYKTQIESSNYQFYAIPFFERQVAFEVTYNCAVFLESQLSPFFTQLTKWQNAFYSDLNYENLWQVKPEYCDLVRIEQQSIELKKQLQCKTSLFL
jgi:hypothetical protein